MSYLLKKKTNFSKRLNVNKELGQFVGQENKDNCMYMRNRSFNIECLSRYPWECSQILSKYTNHHILDTFINCTKVSLSKPDAIIFLQFVSVWSNSCDYFDGPEQKVTAEFLCLLQVDKLEEWDMAAVVNNPYTASDVCSTPVKSYAITLQHLYKVGSMRFKEAHNSSMKVRGYTFINITRVYLEFEHWSPK